MKTLQQNLQDEFLEALKQGRAQLSIYLVNGIHLTGWIAAFDRYAILLGSPAGTQLIYKQNISTIMPIAQVKLEPNTASTAKRGEVSVDGGGGNENPRVTVRKKRTRVVAG